MTLEHQALHTETYSIKPLNGVPVVVAETRVGTGIPADGDGLVGTVIGSLSRRAANAAIDNLGQIVDTYGRSESTSFGVAVSIPTWRINDVVAHRSTARIEASYAAHAMGRARASDALVNRCLLPSGAPKRVITSVLDDNTSYVRLVATVNGLTNEGPFTKLTFLLTEGFVYAAHRPLRLAKSHTKHPSRDAV